MMRIELFFLALVCFHLTGADNDGNGQPQARHTSCTANMIGLPSCTFDRSFCGTYKTESLDSGGLSWKRGANVFLDSGKSIQKDWQPTKTRKGNFAYLDVTHPSIPIGSKSRLEANILSPSVKAVCIEFYYATLGDSDNVPSFGVYNRLNNGGKVIIGKIKENTQGIWKAAQINSCVGKRSKISFEGQKTSASSIVALDYIHVTKSTMNCSEFDEDMFITSSIPMNPDLSSMTTFKTPTHPRNMKTTTFPTPPAELTTTPVTVITQMITEMTQPTIAPTKKDGARIVITPDKSIQTIDTEVKIHCDLGDNSNKDSYNKYREIYVVNIVKDDEKQIALMTPGSKIYLKHDDVAKRVQASGNLDDDLSATYLTVTLLQPKVEDTGSYSCVISYQDQIGLLKQEKDFARLEVNELKFENNPLLGTVVNSLVRQIGNLNEENLQQKLTLKNWEDKNKGQEEKIKHLEAEDQQRRRDITNLYAKTQKQDEKINDLKIEIDETSAFSATIKEKRRRALGSKMVIVFDDVIMRQGQGYDETTGIFTAQAPGLYAFHLTMAMWSALSNTYTQVDLVVNDQPKATIQTENDFRTHKGYQDQSSISLVVALSKGDTVKAVAVDGTVADEGMDRHLSLFSGYLVRPY